MKKIKWTIYNLVFYIQFYYIHRNERIAIAAVNAVHVANTDAAMLDVFSASAAVNTFTSIAVVAATNCC